MSSVLADVRKLVFDSLGGRRVDVYLYGSWARSEAGRASDIDVALLPHEPIPGDVLSSLREQLEESTIPYPVEIVDLSGADKRFRERVLSEGIRWTEPTNA